MTNWDIVVAGAGHNSLLTAAYAAHPERFVRRPPAPPALPAAVWINPPAPISGPQSQIVDGAAPQLATEPLTASRIDVDQGGRYLGTPSNGPSHASTPDTSAEVRH